jgi:hypothetical protein
MTTDPVDPVLLSSSDKHALNERRHRKTFFSPSRQVREGGMKRDAPPFHSLGDLLFNIPFLPRRSRRPAAFRLRRKAAPA